MKKCLQINVVGPEDVLDAEQQTEYRSLLGAYMYLMNSRVDCLYSQSHHGRHSHEPTTSDMNLLRGTCVFAAQTAECGLYYPSHSAIMAGHRPGFENLGSGQKAELCLMNGSGLKAKFVL